MKKIFEKGYEKYILCYKKPNLSKIGTSDLNYHWDIKAKISSLANDKFTLLPGRSLIRNIGFIKSHTNTPHYYYWFYNNKTIAEDIKIRKIPVEESVYARKILQSYYRPKFPRIYRGLYIYFNKFLEKIA